jgi:hypothetical protein
VFVFRSEFDVGDVEDAVGRDVAGGVVHFIQDLLGTGHHIEPAAGIVELAQREAASRGDVGIRKADVDRVFRIFLAGVDEAAAGELRRALHQVPCERAHREFRVVVVAPTEAMHHAAEEQTRIGHAPGHHHRCTGGQPRADQVRAQIGIGRGHARNQ